MSDAKPLRLLTREHRVLATQALNWCGQPGTDLQRWVDTGSPEFFPSLAAAAELFASAQRRAEYRVREALIADLRGLLERAYQTAPGAKFIYADSIELLIETLEAQNAG